jgi:hypothetical protein
MYARRVDPSGIKEGSMSKISAEKLSAFEAGQMGVVTKKTPCVAPPSFVNSDVVCVCVCVLSHWVHAAIVEVPDLPSLKCSCHWSLRLCFQRLSRTFLCSSHGPSDCVSSVCTATLLRTTLFAAPIRFFSANVTHAANESDACRSPRVSPTIAVLQLHLHACTQCSHSNRCCQ